MVVNFFEAEPIELWKDWNDTCKPYFEANMEADMQPVNSKKTGTIIRGGILKPKMADMEAAMYVKPSPF